MASFLIKANLHWMDLLSNEEVDKFTGNVSLAFQVTEIED